MTQPPQGGQPPQGPGDAGRPGGASPQGPGQQGPSQQGYPSQPGPSGQPPFPPQGYPPAGARPPQGYPPQGNPQQGYPPQGNPQQGYPPQQPYPGAPGPQGAGYGVPPGGPQPYPYGPYGPVPGQTGQQPKKKRTGLFVLIGVGALALILAVVAVGVNLAGRSDSAGGGSGGGTGGGGASSAPAAATASDAVQGYLQAVAKGDAQAAVAYAVDPTSVKTTYMTPAVLAASAKLAPLTDIQVGTSDPDATTVPVTYRLGSTRVDTSYDVLKASDGTWKLIQVASILDLSAVQDDAVPMLVNGLRVKPGPFSVLPGTYRITTGQRNFDYGTDPTLVVRYPSDFPDSTRVAPRVSSAGQKSALAAVKKSWSSCLDKHAQTPKGCPN